MPKKNDGRNGVYMGPGSEPESNGRQDGAYEGPSEDKPKKVIKVTADDIANTFGGLIGKAANALRRHRKPPEY